MPSGSQYVQALQTPAFAFLDEELAGGEVDRTPIGLPRPISGNTASVFGVTGASGRRWAVRCFVRWFPDQQRRYEAISAELASVDASWKVGFELQPEGIVVDGAVHPIVKMEWLDARPLAPFVEAHLWDGDVLAMLALAFAGVVEDLRLRGIAHGDLQHGNVLVTDGGELKLIDYDGMYVPALAGLPSNELGHRNYRHPLRTLEDFSSRLDAFPGWVLFVSLAALSLDPLLWGRLDGGDERLLFREEDFTDPDASEAFAAFARSEVDQVRYYGALLQQLLAVPPESLPALSLSAAPQLAPVRLHAAVADDERALYHALRRSADVEVGEEAPAADGLRDRIRRLAGATAAGEEAVELRAAVTAAEAEIRRLEHQRAEIDRREAAARADVTAAIDAVRRAEHGELRRIGDELVRLRAAVGEEQRRLAAAMEEERRTLLEAATTEARRQALHRERVATVPGLGDGVVFALARLGVRAATDFVDVRADAKSAKQGGGLIVLTDGREVRAASVGPQQAELLMRWKRVVETRVEASLPTELPEEQELELRRRYAAQAQEVQAREPSARAEAAHASLAAQQRSAAEQARLQDEFQRVQREAAAERVRVDRAIAAAKKDVAEARFRLLGAPR